MSFLEFENCVVLQLLSIKFYKKYIPHILQNFQVKNQKTKNDDFENTLYWFSTGHVYSVNIELEPFEWK